MSKFITFIASVFLLTQIIVSIIFLSSQAKFDNSSDFLLMLVVTVCAINISKLQGDSRGKDSSKEQTMSES